MIPLLTWAALAASFVLGLAAAIRMAGPASGIGGDGGPSVIRLPEAVTAAIALVFALAAVVVLVHLVRRAISRRPEDEEPGGSAIEPRRAPPWLRALRQVLAIANGVVIAYLLWRGMLPLSLLSLDGASGLAGGFGLPRAMPDSAPLLVTWTFGVLAGAAALGALAFALWIALGDRPAPGPPDATREPPPALEQAVEESLDALASEPDARRAIIRCYAGFERAAAASGLPRRPALTPMEFMREATARLPVPRAAVPTLTALFELARFSDHSLGVSDRDRAVHALQAIRLAIAPPESHAASG